MPFFLLQLFKGPQRFEPGLGLTAALIRLSFLRNEFGQNVCRSLRRPPARPMITVTPDLQNQAFAVRPKRALFIRIGGAVCGVDDFGNPMGKPTGKRVA